MKTLGQALKLITHNPVNLFLAIIPTAIAFGIYLLMIFWAFTSLDTLTSYMQGIFPSAETAGVVGKILTGILILLIFLLMSWTFVIVVGFLASPFNSMLSSRIEAMLLGKSASDDRKSTIRDIIRTLGATFQNEMKKVVFIALVAGCTLVLNFFPLFYPVGLFFVALLLAIQFIDYSWSRHDYPFGECLKDLVRNIIPYSLSGFFFLLLITIPIINAFIPALATSYFTILWLKRQNKI